ncbi:MAG TPA: hypothetical protein VGD66_13605 [Allosphingosinicella sp.]|jgi:hypothetical protein
MRPVEPRRPLEDVIGELVDGLAGVPTPVDRFGRVLRPTSVSFALPVETRVTAGPGGLVVHADMPSTRTRTDFDLPVGRLALTVDAVPTEGWS